MNLVKTAKGPRDFGLAGRSVVVRRVCRIKIYSDFSLIYEVKPMRG